MIHISTTCWNNVSHLMGFVESLERIVVPYKLFVWDNGSIDETPETLEMIKNLFDTSDGTAAMKSFEFVRVSKNLGMVPSWNWALDQFQHDPEAKYAFICNDDIRFTSTFNNLITFMDEYPEYGLVCPAMLPKGTDPEKAEEIAKEFINPDKVDEGGLEGPVMGISRLTLDRVGYFDPQFRNSFNDMDYHQRVIRAGMKTVVYHGAAVWHFGGASTSKLGMKIDNNPYYERFQKKHG